MPPRGAATRQSAGARVVGEILARSEAMKPPSVPAAFGLGLASLGPKRHRLPHDQPHSQWSPTSHRTRAPGARAPDARAPGA